MANGKPAPHYLKIIAIAAWHIAMFSYSCQLYAKGSCCRNHGGVKECRGTPQHLCYDGYIGNCPKHSH